MGRHRRKEQAEILRKQKLTLAAVAGLYLLLIAALLVPAAGDIVTILSPR